MYKKLCLLIVMALLALTAHAKDNRQLQFPIPSNQQLMIDKVVLNWFEYENNPKILFNRDIWWTKNKEVDDTIRTQYQDLSEEAVQGKLDQWLESPLGALAFIILIDQFSRNMHRDSPKMYENDYLALTAAKEAISRGYDKRLNLTERVFLYLPLEHSENLEDQNQSVALFEQLYQDTPSELKPIAQNYLNFAKAHQKVIKEFNRFPTRNKILSRESTPQEKAYLKTNPAF